MTKPSNAHPSTPSVSATPQAPNAIQKPAAPSPAADANTPPALPRVDSIDLMNGARRLAIMHNGAEYFLQVTRSGRLILTK